MLQEQEVCIYEAALVKISIEAMTMCLLDIGRDTLAQQEMTIFSSVLWLDIILHESTTSSYEVVLDATTLRDNTIFFMEGWPDI